MSPHRATAPETDAESQPAHKRLCLMLRSYWLIHTILASLSLLLTLPMLMTGALSHSSLNLLGYALTACIALSALWLLISLIITALKIRNIELIARLGSFIAIWAFFLGLFSLAAYVAKLDKLHEVQAHTTQQSIPVHLPMEKLMGESSLQLYYHLDDSADEADVNIAMTKSLNELSARHPQLLRQFIENAPRWKHPMSDQFYAELGHVVLTDADDPAGTEGSVHASFRRLIEGENIPLGYSPAKPGAPFPTDDAHETGGDHDIPDIALDLGGDYILLLAWRGRSEDRALAYQAINAAIIAIDDQFEALLKRGSLTGVLPSQRRSVSHRGTKPEIRLNSPPSQYGCYQAEVYANPHQNGYFSLIAKDIESGKEMTTISFRSLYSFDDQELFRHELPQSLPTWMREEEWIPRSSPEKKDLPLFTIEQSDQLRSILVDLELWFTPYGNQQVPRILTSKRYRVQSFQPRILKPEQIMQESTVDTQESATKDTSTTSPASFLRSRLKFLPL